MNCMSVLVQFTVLDVTSKIDSDQIKTKSRHQIRMGGGGGGELLNSGAENKRRKLQ